MWVYRSPSGSVLAPWPGRSTATVGTFAASSNGTTRSQHQAPCQAPWIRTTVAVSESSFGIRRRLLRVAFARRQRSDLGAPREGRGDEPEDRPGDQDRHQREPGDQPEEQDRERGDGAVDGP